MYVKLVQVLATRSALIFAVALGLAGCWAEPAAWAADSTASPELVQLSLAAHAGGYDVVGEFLSETADSVTIIDLKSGKQRAFPKTSVMHIKRDLSDTDAVAGSDLATVMAWKVNKLSANAPIVARVAKISDATIYLTLGSKDGLTVGQKMNVFRTGDAIVDPVTKKVIARERPRIAQLTITEVQEAYSKAKLVGELEVALAVGDEVETIPLKVCVAVLPLTDADGKETEAGVAVAEDMTTALVGKKVSVVERTAIMSVMNELALQSSDLFDSSTVQRLGKQIGASTVLTGKIVPEAGQSKVHVRLISVETGQVLLAASQTLGTTVAAAGGTPDSKPEIKSIAGFTSLGGRSSLPGFLTTSDAVGTVKNGMDLRGNKFLHTRDRNLFKGDFTLDVVCTRSAGDGILLFGVGELADAGGEPPSAIKLRFHAPDLAEGYIGFNAPGKAEETLGKIRTAGTHLLRVEKSGNALTISVWANYDGKLAETPDMSKTVPDLAEFAPNIVKSGCVFFGDGVFNKVKLTR